MLCCASAAAARAWGHGADGCRLERGVHVTHLFPANSCSMTATPLARSPRSSRGLRLAALSRLAAFIFLVLTIWRCNQLYTKVCSTAA